MLHYDVCSVGIYGWVNHNAATTRNILSNFNHAEVLSALDTEMAMLDKWAVK